MNVKLNLYIVRHGKTIMNTLDRVQGWCDSPLTQEGIEKAQLLGKGMKDITFSKAYCSDLNRTRQTARVILKSIGTPNVPIIEMEGIREVCFGSFEADFNATMWEKAALKLEYPSFAEMYEDILKNKISYKTIIDTIKTMDTINMAESFKEVEDRSQKSLFKILDIESKNNIEEKNILIVSHGMSILCMLHNLGGDELLKGHLDNLAVCKAEYIDGKFDVLSMGDMSYLERGESIF